jgi:UDP-glucose 4-epimerase
VRSVCLRYFNAAGASGSGLIGEAHEPETHLIPNVLMAALREEPVTVYGADYATADGSCVRDYVHVHDLCRAHLAALEYLQEGGESRVLNLGSQRGHSVFEVLAAAQEVCGRPIARRIERRRDGDPPSLVADASRAEQTLDWKARESRLGDILASAWVWHQAQFRAATT